MMAHICAEKFPDEKTATSFDFRKKDAFVLLKKAFPIQNQSANSV
jgi:hypothetical protein